MSLDIYLAFVLASALLVVLPGPTVMLVVANALSRGRPAAMKSVIGVGLGDVTAMVVSFAGLGAVLAASATLFTALKFVGAAYLIWLGIGLLRAKPDPSVLTDVQPSTGRQLIRQAAVHGPDCCRAAAVPDPGQHLPGAGCAERRRLCLGRGIGAPPHHAGLDPALDQPGRRIGDDRRGPADGGHAPGVTPVAERMLQSGANCL